MTQTRRDRLARLVWAGLLLLYFAIGLTRLNGYAWDYDEGVVLQSAVLNGLGFDLYSEISFNKPPLLIWWLRLAFAAFGQSLLFAQLAVLVLTTAGVLALGLLAEAWWGRWAGAAATLFYLLIPETPLRAAVIMNDLPAMAAVLAAFYGATRFRQGGRPAWLALGGLAWGLALGLHPIMLYTALPLALVGLWPRPGERLSPRNVLLRGLYFFLPAALVTLAWFLVIDRAAFLNWLLAYNRAPLSPLLAERARNNWRTLGAGLGAHWFLLLPAAVGAVVQAFDPTRRFWSAVVLLWFTLTVLALNTLQPMWPHYVILALIPLILPAAGSVSWAAGFFGRGKRTPGQTGRRSISFLILLWLAVAIIVSLRLPRDWPMWPEGAREAWATLGGAAQGEPLPAGALIIADNPFMAFVAGRWIVPPLVDTSAKRTGAGYLTVADIARLQRAYGSEHLILETEGYLSLLGPAIYQWADSQAVARQTVGRFTHYDLPPVPALATPLEATLGGLIRLQGFTLQQPVAAGDALQLALFWQALERPAQEYHVFVHVVNEAGELVAQHDGPPLAGWAPTTTWPPGAMVIDTFTIPLAASLPPGEYELLAGMYSWPDQVRLAASGETGAIPLAKFRIE